MTDFSQINNWVFDLDNTLYSPDCRLFDQIDERMGSFIANRLDVDRIEARKIQKGFFHKYGTTLAGLMKEHDVKPEEFLPFVHDIDRSVIPPDGGLDQAIANLPGKKYVCTNGTVSHAQATLAEIGITHHFEDIFDIKAFGYVPKPAAVAYDVMLKQTGIDPTQTAFFEDIAKNLKVPHELGMSTVLIKSPGNEDAHIVNRLNGDENGADYVHHITQDLSHFLQSLKTN